jgi:Tfp pilus assembly protein FimT
MKMADVRGVTVMELVVVVALSGIVMGIAGFSVNALRNRNDGENQVRQMHSDMLNARVRAFQGKRMHFVTVTARGYQIVEDTNDSGGTKPDAGDRALWPVPKQFRYNSEWSGTVIMDAKGIMSKSTGPLVDSAALAIRFDTSGIKPDNDCISVGPTRIRAGQWDGINCVAR